MNERIPVPALNPETEPINASDAIRAWAQAHVSDEYEQYLEPQNPANEMLGITPDKRITFMVLLGQQESSKARLSLAVGATKEDDTQPNVQAIYYPESPVISLWEVFVRDDNVFTSELNGSKRDLTDGTEELEFLQGINLVPLMPDELK